MAKKPNSCSSTSVGDNLNSAQQNLRERERLLRVLTDHLPGHIAYVGADDLCYHFVNQRFESSFGRPREEIIGQHIKEIIGESNYEFALKYIEEVRAGKSTFLAGQKKRSEFIKNIKRKFGRWISTRAKSSRSC